jgi:hypothetical protein
VPFWIAAFSATCPVDFNLTSYDGSSCYRLEIQRMSWSSASVHCASLSPGAHLAFINSIEEQNDVFSLVVDHPGESVPKNFNCLFWISALAVH